MEVTIIHSRDNGATIESTLTDVEILRSDVSYKDKTYNLHIVCDFGPKGKQVDTERDKWGGTGDYDETLWSTWYYKDLYFSSSTPIKMRVEP